MEIPQILLCHVALTLMELVVLQPLRIFTHTETSEEETL